MPSITLTHNLEVSLERFLEACTLSQLYELELLLGKKLNQVEQELEIQDMDKASMKHKILTKKSESHENEEKGI
ncbi:MAG: hypothetical protein P1P88_04955 [Bacteroidales bacterium]|nr:hypothetical protein [Bacteroidales bacterium]